MDLDAQMTREARKVQGRAQAAERGANEKAAKVAKAASIRKLVGRTYCNSMSGHYARRVGSRAAGFRINALRRLS